ncbi:MAG TPA: TPM domain-containing protein [Candidatus Gallacutalibacter pullistercoris]|nr:TPM domain-containing protein [Candidatus Gallacutalibacter pullistercoris]
MKKKVTISLCAAVLLCVLLSFGSVFAASSKRVYDQAGLFTAEEVTELEKRVAGHCESTNLDIVIVTTDNTMGKTSRDYADDFYDYNGFGVGDDHSGVLLLIDMDNRMAYMSTTGKAIRIFTDDTIQAITDRVASCLGSGNYAEGVRVFLNEVEDCVNPNIWGMVLGCLIIGMVGGTIAVASVWHKYTHGHKADQYELSENSSIYLAGREDVFLRRYVTSRNISSNNSSGGGGGSSTHTSSSGTSHGGGGSSF